MLSSNKDTYTSISATLLLQLQKAEFQQLSNLFI